MPGFEPGGVVTISHVPVTPGPAKALRSSTPDEEHNEVAVSSSSGGQLQSGAACAIFALHPVTELFSVKSMLVPNGTPVSANESVAGTWVKVPVLAVTVVAS